MAWLRYRKRSRIARLVLLASLLTATIYGWRHRDLLTQKLDDWKFEHGDLDDCTAYPDHYNIAVVVKTGATEAERLLPTLLKTSLRCVKEPIIVSDLEQTIAGHKVHDVFANFTPRAMEGNVDFDIYRLQQQFKAEGREKQIHKLSSVPIPGNDWRTQGKSAAWGLDKYKNIRMVELAWRVQPNREWYIFIDADTYLIWNNLQRWLATLKHKKRLYVGQPVRMYEHQPAIDFAYGGAGILLSRATVREYVEADFAHRWDYRIQGWWFGDFMLADALFEQMDLRVTDGTPMMGADNSIDAAYGPHNWCRPVVTMHHLAHKDALALYRIERAAGSSVVLGKDVYHTVPREGLPKQRNDWDNRSEDETEHLIPINGVMAEYAHDSVTACEAACQTESRCFQYMYTQQTHTADNGAVGIENQCSLSSMFRLGAARSPAQWSEYQGSFRKTFTSGWNNVRILTWTTVNNECPEDAGLWSLKSTTNLTSL